MNNATDDIGLDSFIEDRDGRAVQIESSGDAPGGGLLTLLGGFQEGAQLRGTDDPDEAVTLAVSVGRRLLELAPGDDIGDVEELLREIIPEEVGDVGRAELLARTMAHLDPTQVDQTAASAAANLPIESAAAEVAFSEAIDLASDTIGELRQGLVAANRDLDDTREELEDTCVELDAAQQQGGLIQWFTSRLESLSFGFGWWTLYFAILMPWMKGQTPGKRVMGLRVVRLDGQPVTWWHAFERAGGYAAGLATGTLGFVQIYWDANRQAIHDKVAGTVVIREGAAKVPGNWDQQLVDNSTPPSTADRA